MKLRKICIEKWHSLEKKKRDSYLQKIEKTLNYFVNAILLAIPLQIILFFIFKFPIINYFYLVIMLFILIPYFEHYYIWLRDEWKNDVNT